MGVLRKRILAAFVAAALASAFLDICFGHQCGHHHHSHHDDDQHHQQHQHGSHGQHRDLQGYEDGLRLSGSKLPEELAEEEDLKLYGIGFHRDHDHDHDHDNGHERVLSGLGLWVHAMACSLLVSMASLICLILLPFIFVQGKPSKAVVDSLAVFGAGAMLGDAFLHQLPHAFGGRHSHVLDHSEQHAHDHAHLGQEPSHAHSLEDLSVGLSILAGIVLFLLVEKLVRYVDDASGGVNAWGHSHHQHHIKKHKKFKDDVDDEGDLQPQSITDKEESTSQKSGKEMMDIASSGRLDGETRALDEPLLRKRNIQACSSNDKPCLDANGSRNDSEPLKEREPYDSPSNLVFGYLNLFSDGVHNFTDGMALGSAFYLYGSVGGWSRTLFLLAHELPQEVGDFGILVRSGFTVSKALCFNFLSALVALAGTALALLLGQKPGQSSFIEGFTAGGFIYIAVAGVLAEMNNNGQSTVKSTAIQLTFLVLGMMVALCISLVE